MKFNNNFTPEYFIALMIHLCLMTPIKDGYYLMPAILYPLAYDSVLVHCKEYNSVEPLLLCFPTTKCVPYGIFTNLVAFIINKKYATPEENSVEVQLVSIEIVSLFNTQVFLQCSQ